MTDGATKVVVDIHGTESEPTYVDINGVKTAYRRKGSGEPVLFLHGMGLADSWLPSHELLSEQVDLIAPQFPGFGKTARPLWYRNVDDVLGHYIDFLNALGLDKVHVVGLSFGGLVAGSFAAAYPERVLSLTLVAPLPLPVVRAPQFEGTHQGEDAPPNIQEMLFGESYLDYAEYDPAADLGLFVAEADDEFSPADPTAFSFDPGAGTYRRLARITAPKQILIADNDVISPESVSVDWAKWLGDTPIIKLSGDKAPTAHMVTEIVPEKYVAAVVDFIKTAK